MTPRTILITGASSGIGSALATAYAGPGTTLALGGRDAGRLAAVVAVCRQRGAVVSEAAIDVRDASATRRWIEAADDAASLDLVIANAGISAGSGGGSEGEEQLRRIIAVNVDGVINTIMPALDRMRARRRGQIAVMSSLAGFRGFPGAPGYCASKAAVRIWAESLRADLATEGIGISVICPGYVATPMTAVNRFPMPFLMSAERSAAIICRRLARNRPRIAFPWPMYLAVRLLAALPTGAVDRLLSRFPRKGPASD